jgi:hypothetical protein
MNPLNVFISLLNRFPAAAAILYAGVVLGLGITAWTTMAQIQERRDEIAETAATLSQLEGRTPAAAPRGRGRDAESAYGRLPAS